MIITRAVTILSESRAFKISRKIIPKEREKETGRLFKKILKVNAIVKNKGIKSKLICKRLACVKVSG